MCSYVTSQSDPEEPVVRLANPEVLKQHFENAGIPLELPDGQAATSTDNLLAGVSTALRYSVRTGHPGFFNQLYARADAVSIAADWLAVAANTNVHTYEVAPVFTAIEVEVLSKLARCVGGEYASCHDGLFAPGGSISNIYGTQPTSFIAAKAMPCMLPLACSPSAYMSSQVLACQLTCRVLHHKHVGSCITNIEARIDLTSLRN